MQTVRTAIQYGTDLSAAVEAGGVPAAVAALVNGELSTMTTISWKSIALLFFLSGSVTAGVGSLALRDLGIHPSPGNPRSSRRSLLPQSP